MSNRLFEEFSPVSKNTWKEKLIKDLKGRPYEKMIKLSEAGIAVEPLYHLADLPSNATATFPGSDDFRRGSSPLMHAARTWDICQSVFFPSVAEILSYLEAQGGPLQSIRIQFDSEIKQSAHLQAAIAKGKRAKDGLWLNDWKDLETLSNWAKTNQKKVWLDCGRAALDLMQTERMENLEVALDFQQFDWENEAFLNSVATILQQNQEKSSKQFVIDLGELELQAANGLQQIAFALAMAVELATRLESKGLTAHQLFSKITFRFPIGTEFLTEIAKIRAFRSLWANVLEAYSILPNAKFFHIQAYPAASSETIADPQVNILRETTMVMSAIFAGCDLVEMPPYDHLFEASNSQSLRIARNIQLVLREESDLGKVIDPAGGAYFVEHATNEIAEKAWAEFQAIEANGGWLNEMKQTRISNSLKENQALRDSAIKTGKKVLLGTNLYPKAGEKIKTQKREFSQNQRAAELFEALRYRMQAHEAATDKPVKVQLFSFGNPAMRSARVNFSSNLFAAAGFLCLEKSNSEALPQALETSIQENPEIVVLCAADEDYEENAANILQQLHASLPKAKLILAGKPPSWENWLALGLDATISAGMDRYQFLLETMNALNIGREAQNEA